MPAAKREPIELVEDVVEEAVDEEDEAECGRWTNARLQFQCRLAGTEWCDWDCPIGLPHRKRGRK